MDRDWLAERLDAGASIEALARETGRDPSTVASWVRKHGLRSSHAERHAARGGIAREELAALVEQDLTVRQIAVALDRSPTTVRHWLKRHALTTSPTAQRPGARPTRFGTCARHGPVPVVGEQLRCPRCRSEHVSSWRRRAKQTLVDEAGGACVLCGYSRSVYALQFHHVDPAEKRYALSGRGLTRAMADLREEAAKCVLLCATCHAEVEAGVAKLPPSSHGRG